MAKGYSVELSSKGNIVFPDECVVCRSNAHGQKNNISILPVDYSSAFSNMDVPMHERCSSKYSVSKLMRYGTVFLILAIFLLIFILYFNITKEPFLQYFLKRIIHFAALIIVLIPLLRWHSNHPLPIEGSHGKGKYIFTFEDRPYAEHFAEMNNTHAKKRV